MNADDPTHVAGFQIHTGVTLGSFGRSFVGFHSREGRKILKVLREGEDLAFPEEEYGRLRDDPSLLHFDLGQQHDGKRVLVAHFVQAASLGVLALGSELQRGCEKSLVDLDPNGDCGNTLRQATLAQRAELVRSLAQRVEQLHNEKKSFPFVTPFNVVFSDGRTKLVDFGLGYQPDKLDLAHVHEDVLAYYAPEVVRCLAEKKPIQVSPAADVYALALTARTILMKHVVEIEAAQSAGSGKRDALLQGKTWKRAPQEEISRKLEDLLARGAAREPGRRPTAAQFVKELDAIIREKSVNWTPPSPMPKILAGVAAVVVVAGATVFALLPDAKEKTARVEYAKATASSSAADRLAAVAKAEKELVFESTKATLPEFGRLKAIALLEDAAKNPQAAIDALRAYAAKPVSASEGDALTARFLAAFIQKWALMDNVEAKKELEAVFAATAPDAASKNIPTLAAVALKLAPFGIETEFKVEEAKKWLEDVRLASTDENSSLKCTWTTSGGYEKIEPAPRPLGFKAEWVAKLLLARLKDELGDDGETSLKEGAAAFNTFASSGAVALHASKVAKDEASITAARALLSEAKKLKKDAWTWGEGELALADLTYRAAASSKDGPIKAYRDAAKAYETAAKEKPATDKLDLTAKCKKGQLLAGFQLGLAVAANVAKDPSAALEPALAREGEGALTAVIEAANDKTAGKDFGVQGMVADAHVALGLILMVQQNRAAESFEHLNFVYSEQDVTKGYRKAESPANQATSRLFFDYFKGQFFALVGNEGKIDVTAQQQLLQKIDALAKLEKFDLSWLSLANAKAQAKAAAEAKSGKKRTDALIAVRASFDAVFESAPESWQDALEGRVGASLALVRESTDASAAGGHLIETTSALDHAAQVLKERKVAAKEVDRILIPLRAGVRAEWFLVVGRWLEARGDSTDLSNESDLAFAKRMLEVAEAANAPEVQPRYKATIAQVHYVIGRWFLDQKINLSEAVVHLADAVEELGEEKKALASRAALLAADVALTRANEVREGPWGTDAKAAAKWGRDLLAKREGFASYDALARAIKENKIPSVWPDIDAANRLVQDILKNAATVTVEDAAFAARISPQSALAHLLLARGRSATGAKPEARVAALEVMKYADGQKQPEIVVEAARICFVNTPDPEVASSEFKGVVDRAKSLMTAAAAKWKGAGDPKLPDAFACLYWEGRHFEQRGVDAVKGGAAASAKQDFTAGLAAYDAYRRACAENGANLVSEASDLEKHVRNCAINSGG